MTLKKHIKKAKCKVCCPDGGAVFHILVMDSGRYWQCQNCMSTSAMRERKLSNENKKVSDEIKTMIKKVSK